MTLSGRHVSKLLDIHLLNIHSKWVFNRHPVNIPVWASTVPVLVRCWQHRPSTGPLWQVYGGFTPLYSARCLAGCSESCTVHSECHMENRSLVSWNILPFVTHCHCDNESKSFNTTLTIMTQILCSKFPSNVVSIHKKYTIVDIALYWTL